MPENYFEGRSLGQGSLWPFFTMDESIHEMIRQLCYTTGDGKPARIRLCTFSISESAIRELILLREDNLIDEIEIIIDHTARKNKLDMLLFANENAKVFLADVHAKVILINTGIHHIVIMTSSNLNTIKRWEAGIVCIDHITGEFFVKQLDELVKTAIPFTID